MRLKILNIALLLYSYIDHEIKRNKNIYNTYDIIMYDNI